MEKVLVHYAEIALKGKNRIFFENKLVNNIKESAKYSGTNLKSVKRQHNIILCEFDDKRDKINSTLKSVFGMYMPCSWNT